MTTTKWSDFGSMWNTLRELDVSAIREEAERPLDIVCAGHAAALEVLEMLLRRGPQRYGMVGANPLTLLPLEQASERSVARSMADMLVLAIDARVPISAREVDAFDNIDRVSLPYLVVLFYGDRPNGGPLPRAISAHVVVVADPDAVDASDRLAQALLERLPSELHLAAARRLPGLRAIVTRELINTTSFTNATYSLASGLPEQIPLISVPFAAADILVLTKNQALMVYRLALAYGAPPDFQARIREVIPVVGSAFLWRQAARTLVGLIPIWGLVPKIAVAYAGTYTTGVAAARWFATGEVTSTEQIKRILNDARALGRQRAEEIIARARRSKGNPDEPKASLADRIKRLLPSRKK